VAYRVFPILIAGYFIIRRQWRPLIFMGLGLVIVGAITVATLGVPLCASYVDGMQSAMLVWRDPTDVALRAFCFRVFFYLDGLPPDGRFEVLRFVTITTGQIVIVALNAWPTYQRRRQAGLDRRTFGLWVAAAIVLSPLSWIHYMVLLIIPFVEIASAAEQHNCHPRAIWAAIASYVLIGITRGLREVVVGATWWEHGIKYLAEGSSVALLLGFLAAWWLATESIGSRGRENRMQPSPAMEAMPLPNRG